MSPSLIHRGTLQLNYSSLSLQAAGGKSIVHGVPSGQWFQSGGISDIKGSVPLLFWNLHIRGQRERKERECKLQSKAHRTFDPRNNSTHVLPAPIECTLLSRWDTLKYHRDFRKYQNEQVTKPRSSRVRSVRRANCRQTTNCIMLQGRQTAPLHWITPQRD